MEEKELHDFRKQIDACISKAEEDLNQEWKEGYPVYGRELALARTKLQEAKMWVGKCLERKGSERPAEFRDKAEGE